MKQEQEKKAGKLVIFRHGETVYNKKGLMTGLADAELTERGIEQARDVGRALDGFDFDKIFASTLSRAFQTARIALEHSNGNSHLADSVELRPEIVERDTGDFIGKHKRDPEVAKHPRHDFDRKLPGGESGRDVFNRVAAFFDDELMPRMERGETVMVSCHAGIYRAFELVLGVKDQAQAMMGSIPNATPLVAEFEDGRMTTVYSLMTKGAGDLKKRRENRLS